MIKIDGSQGEGGGQMLRSALTLSILTQQPFNITAIRARRSQPGLKAQHLAAVKAAAAVSRAEVNGAQLGSQELTFNPGAVRSGRYKFEVGTAGAATLVLQTISLPLSFATSASTVQITGGTHVPWSPCFHYLDMQWIPFLRRAGYDIQAHLELAGFYPQGGGRIMARIRPAGAGRALTLLERGEILRVYGVSGVSNLDLSIADRQRRRALLALANLGLSGPSPGPRIQTEKMPSPGKGTVLLVVAEFSGGQACFFGLGARGKPAEQVAQEATDELADFLKTPGAIDLYLADQLLLPLAFVPGTSTLQTSCITPHLVTNAAIIRAFEAAEVNIEGDLHASGRVHIQPA